MTLQRDDFEYDGLNSRDDLQVEMGNVVLPSAPAMAEQVTDIPAMYGNQFNGTDFTSRTISIPVSIYCADNEDAFNQVMHHLSGLLLSDNPSDNGKEYPLVFGFEPKVTYWGHITAISEPAPINPGMYDMTLTITFVQSDPRANLPQVEKPLNNGLNTITVDGTARTAPVIQVVPKRPLKYIGFNLNGGQFGLGPETPNDQANAVQPDVHVIDDPIASMAMWTNDANAISGIKTDGKYNYQGSAEINADTTVMRVAYVNGGKDFGKMPTNQLDGTWLGPTYRYTGMTKALPNYRVRAGLHHMKYWGTHNFRAMGKAQFSLLDASGNTIGRFVIGDHMQGGQTYVALQLCKPGSTFDDDNHQTLYWGYGPSGAFRKYHTHYSDLVNKSSLVHSKYVTVVNREEVDCLTSSWVFMDLTKAGNVYTWELHQYSLYDGQPYRNANRYLIASGRWVDTNNEYESALGGFGQTFLKQPITEDIDKVQYMAPYMTLTDLQVWQHNQPQPNKPTYIANAGEEIVMDCETDTVTVNGRLVSPVWSTDYPQLKPGVNGLTMVGDLADAQMTLKYLPKLL
ncbi:phage distal tail protein [Lactiplantibacillus plantarum]|uniref:phage distal tail protein n=1 Tax=Lactiplantibacillus plantarum TaxID=1590 RepID=UPI0005FC1C20|nr:phage tail domain-containing protein [Lactiplantibacillus plantarum]MCG0572784.1 phage tail protein [Lactiplantibacillus plantarum]MCG0810276.1 phage tail protein [Lactiplantibacillus plantarum]UTD41564.1 phage tail family protein [Lactiplantibacillus plantarum]